MIRSLSTPLRTSASLLGARSIAILLPSRSLSLRPTSSTSSSSFLPSSLGPRRSFSSSPSTFFPDYRTPDPNRSTYQSRYDKLQLLLFRVVDEPPPNPDFDAEGNPVQHSKRQIRTLMISTTVFCFIVWGVFQPSDTPDLDLDKWWSFPIEWMEVVDEDETGVSGNLKDGQYKVLTVRMPDDHKKVAGNVETNKEGIYHLMVKDPNLNIERPYTIFHPPEHITGVNTQLSILVKKEPTGEVSKFIHGRKRFNWIELRGPYETKTEIVRSEVRRFWNSNLNMLPSNLKEEVVEEKK
ncbi:hypothetical protein BDY24DRAFT_213867 [Mrakia frigida]|uniref:uncharacterized protein n=1 Tax=Mrakia frigida TaxID=29902 RepID=UPI003FCBF5FF